MISDKSQFPQRLGSWSEHVRSWTDQVAFPVCVLRFEDCVADPVATFKIAFAAGGLHASDAEIADALARSAFSRLRAQEEKAGFRESQSKRDHFFRRGAADAWTDELPGGLARQIEEQHGEIMARFGYL